ncbi:protein kinase [Nocardioides sp. GCM10027113]|uniref:protein kinase domain-containing protein n=1 Tax=unclassified Nocardioides TaxID=2615069 RepID=UPI00361D23B5
MVTYPTATSGELLAGRYALGETLGSGGTGTVWLAHDRVLDRAVALKLLTAGGSDEIERERMRVEAKLAGSVVHPGIAQVYDYGEFRGEGGEDDLTPYIVMEHVEGTTLWRTLREQRTLSARRVMDLVGQVAAALHVAHGAGIVHRDLKPGNILVTHDGRAVLVDFGIARSSDVEPLTRTGAIVGTVDYLSPEQAQGRTATTASDVYSLGMVAYEALTGLKPFHRENQVATALAHLNDRAPALPDDVPPAVADLVVRMIAKDPRRRPTAAEVAQTAAALAEEPVLPPPPSRAVLARLRTPLWRTDAWRSRWMQVAAAAVVGAVVVGGLVAAKPSAAVVPDVEGLTYAAARAELADAGLEAERVWHDGRGERGTVLDQKPAPGKRAGKGPVVLQVASGEAVVDGSALVGLSYEEAARRLVEQGMVPIRQRAQRPGADGTVVTALPNGRLELGTMVTLTIGFDPANR